ncbi:MAG: hypothetical protein DI637_09835 [Citromicrobium sp.]|nr:MAG: hypothetical protein DI637_09835 [Citromicrobium sp.]
MSDHPSTYHARDTIPADVAWDDRASLHRVDDGDGVLDGGKGLRSGTFADLITHMMLLPANERSDYLIKKAGDRNYSAAEVESLSEHPDFPRG